MDSTRSSAAHRLSFETGDLDAAREQVALNFADHNLAVQSTSLDFKLDLTTSSRLSVGLMSYGAQIAIDAPPMRSCYHVNLPLTGVSTVSQHGRRRTVRAGESGVAFLPTGPLSITWSADQRQYVIRLRKEQLEAYAARLSGQPIQPIDFDLTFDLVSGAAQSLLATAAFVYAELTRPGGIAAIPAACQELEAALMTQLLFVVPSQLSRILHGEASAGRPAKIREALAIIDEDPSAPLTTAQLAARVGMSLRSLQLGFQEGVGMTPTAYLCRARLDRVHEDLLLGANGSVTDIAMRWGFFHPGRFAQQYRARFGQLPSQTAGWRAGASR